MGIKWVAALGVLALLATCGTGASHPAAQPATPYPDVGAMSCAPAFTGYRLEFAPNVVVYWDGCGGSDAIYVNGKAQPRLWDHGVLAAALLPLTRS